MTVVSVIENKLNNLQIASWMQDNISKASPLNKVGVNKSLTNWSEDTIHDYASEPGLYKQDTCIVVQPLHIKIQQLKTLGQKGLYP